MLKAINIKNFKCFKEKTLIPVRKINLFTGLNSRGKSTALQALLLMRQSIEHSKTTNKIVLNGSCINLGRFSDVKNSAVSIHEAVEIEFQYKKGDNHLSVSYKLKENVADDMVADISQINTQGAYDRRKFKCIIDLKGTSISCKLNGRIISLQYLYNLFAANIRSPIVSYINSTLNYTKIHYISADRLGPQEFYPKASFADFPNVGIRGEYTANVLAKKKDDSVEKTLCLKEGSTETVLDQTQAWLSKIFSGGNINIESLETNIITMSMNSDNSKSFYKPINIGFGFSYALSIIVSGLISKSGDILIVENPEAHLHPSAQSQIVKFLAMVGSTGVQVLIESHSDHILNGLRLAVLDKLITTDEVNIVYFSRENETLSTKNIIIEQNGRIESWPDGFFDQTEKDFERLFKI